MYTSTARGLVEWSLPVEQLGTGAKYYQHDPKEARRLLAEAGYPKGFKTPLTATSGLGRDLVDAVQLVQRFLKDVGIEAELKIQEYGAYIATTAQGKFGRSPPPPSLGGGRRGWRDHDGSRSIAGSHGKEKPVIHDPNHLVSCRSWRALAAHRLEFPGLCDPVAWALASAAAATIAVIGSA
jgi:ABC-type transport system substrate-binding protein